MKDAYNLARASGIHPNLITTPTNAASQIDATNAFGILLAELDYTHKSRAYHEAKGVAFSHLEQHAQSPNKETANHARDALQKLAIMLG